MASGRLQQSYSGRHEEEDERSSDTETLACGAIPAQSPTPNAAATTEVQAITASNANKCASSTPPISCDVYHYRPLPDGYIRLLRLLPHQDECAPIQCQLFAYPLLDSGKSTHLYEALSYVWGSEEKPLSVSTEMGCIPITTNLHAALKRLRDGFFDRIIWVDAICINQADTEERNRQVRCMAMVYARACRVIVWLGEAEDDSEQALEEIHRAAAEQPTKLHQKMQDAILTLLRRPWFKRIWVSKQM